jgi:MiaB-like tRNA modifying enzyme
MNPLQVFVKSFGCSTSFADGEVLAGCLAEAGYEAAKSASTADVIVYNTCAVKGPTENRMIEILKRAPKNKRLIVAGCLPLINFGRLDREVQFDGVVGPAAGDRIVEVVEHVLKGERILALKGAVEAKPSLALPRVQLNPVISIIPICYGCLGSCAYCCVAFARGKLRSYLSQEIVERVKKDVMRGTREFWLTSQDTACYGRDLGTNLAELLDAICNIKGDFKIRVGMMTPDTVLGILEKLVQSFRSERVFKFLHLPVQSGDDRVLTNMRRFYHVENFKSIVRTFRTSFPELTLSTDIICGFPDESDEAFDETMQLIEEVRPDVVNVSKFFARPKTIAAEMSENRVSLEKIKLRSTKGALLAKKIAFENNQRWIGWIGEALTGEIGKVSGTFIGRNFAYKPIAIKSAENLLGKTLKVKVAEAFPTHLRGEVIE